MSKWPQESRLSQRSKLERQLEEELRSEYARAADNLRAELSAEAAQHFQRLQQQQNIFAQARLRTVESALGTEYASAQQNLQQQYLSQVQGLRNELRIAQRQFSDLLAQERAVKGQEIEALRQELADKQQLICEQANDLQENAKMHQELHANEEARTHETLAMQASQWKTHCDELTQQFEAERLEHVENISGMERDIDDLSSKFTEASEKLCSNYSAECAQTYTTSYAKCTTITICRTMGSYT